MGKGRGEGEEGEGIFTFYEIILMNCWKNPRTR
jgi:hypothetical protein